MFKKVARYFFIVFGLFALWASTYRPFMAFVAERRDGSKWWCGYPMLHGDLVSMSYLDFVKKINPGPDPVQIRHPAYNGKKNTALYLFGDSFTRHLNDSEFMGLCAFNYIDINHSRNYCLDTTKKNILMLEVSERYLQVYYNTLRIFDQVKDTCSTADKITFAYPQTPRKPHYAAISGVSTDWFFNKFINQNLQCNLFNYNFMIFLFEWKAAINYYLFNRASGDVVISDDRNFLFLKETVTHNDVGSSYRQVLPEEITLLVNNFNAIYDHYKAKGFDEVYLSVIPNAATIMQPQGYCNMIPALQQDTRLHIKVIDMYTYFKNTPKVFYRPGDTHWNVYGLQHWIDVVNDRLVNGSK